MFKLSLSSFIDFKDGMAKCSKPLNQFQYFRMLIQQYLRNDQNLPCGSKPLLCKVFVQHFYMHVLTCTYRHLVNAKMLIMCLYHVLDELVTLAYVHYPVVVKGENFQLLQESMTHLVLMFIAMDRHHYNKASPG